ncbi:hypothetical protein D3C76_260340 [compost metagenome]
MDHGRVARQIFRLRKTALREEQRPRVLRSGSPVPRLLAKHSLSQIPVALLENSIQQQSRFFSGSIFHLESSILILFGKSVQVSSRGTCRQLLQDVLNLEVTLLQNR